MKKLTAKETKMLAMLQDEYNEIHERMGYIYDESSIAACNNELDKLVAKMNKILA